MQKNIDVRIAGQERIEAVVIDPNTTAARVLELARCPENYELFLTSDAAPFGKDERIYDRVTDRSKVIASAPVVVGLSAIAGVL